MTSGAARSRAGVIGFPHSSQMPSPPPRSHSSASASFFTSSMSLRCIAELVSKAPGDSSNTNPSTHAAATIRQVAPCEHLLDVLRHGRPSVLTLTTRPDTAYWTLVQ